MAKLQWERGFAAEITLLKSVAARWACEITITLSVCVSGKVGVL